MAESTKTISEINDRLRKGNAVVMTAMEFKKQVRSGYRFKVSDVDVVTTGTRAVMSGTSAVMVVPFEGRSDFGRVERMWINGVPCFPASTPGTHPGHLDVVLYGTQESRDNIGRYGGGHVIRDIVEGKSVEVECETAEGKTFRSSFTIDRLKFARLYNFRNDYQNYMAFMNIKNSKSYRETPSSIFACRPMPRLRGITVSGSGELNPLENDAHGNIIKSGTKVLLNGVPAVIVGYGTRATREKKCLSLSADMFGMDPQFMGGFKTSFGVEVTNGIAVPFPILNRQILDDLSNCLDENIPLHVGDLGDRLSLFDLNYSDVWAGAKLEIEFDPERCICCSFQCPAEYYCPMGAISWREKSLDEKLCAACGACTSNCMGGAFKGKGDIPRGRIGTVQAYGQDVPIVFRQSNRFRAELMATRLKDLLEEGRFLLSGSDFDLKFWNQ